MLSLMYKMSDNFDIYTRFISRLCLTWKYMNSILMAPPHRNATNFSACRICILKAAESKTKPILESVKEIFKQNVI